MLSRARGLLHARAGCQPPTTSKLCIARPTRNYAAAAGNHADFDTLDRAQDGDETTSALPKASGGRPLIRKTLSNQAKDRLYKSSLFEEKEQTLEKESKDTQNTRSASQSPRNKQAVGHQAASDRQVHPNSPEPRLESKPEPKSEPKSQPKPESKPDPFHTWHALKSHSASSRFTFGIVTTSRPLETSLDELIERIQPMESCKVTGTGEHLTTLVILLTPGLARYALDSSVPNAVYQRFCLGPKHRMYIEATSAIVDRLPAGNGEPEGSEGMAYMVFRAAPSPKAEDSTPFQETAQKPGSLTFRMPRILFGQASPVLDYELQLPLSQTLFTTSSVSTLIWRKYALKVKDNSLHLLEEAKLESQTLQLPGMAEKHGLQLTTMPLVPLTPFRKIKYVMGNIIRKLSSQPSRILKDLVDGNITVQAQHPTEEDGDMPASQELEESVSKYFETLDLQPETVSVWALVMPRNTDLSLPQKEFTTLCIDDVLSANDKTITRAWSSKSKHARFMARGTANTIRLLIPQGGRLIKVLSGGGGWGKKAGLLSLDPDVQYSTRELRQDEGWNFDFDGVDDGTEAATEAQRNQALGQIVKEGESIMFLLAPKLENAPEQPSVLSTKPHWKSKGDANNSSLTFGTIPSSIDVVPKQMMSDTGATLVQHYPNQFGMLSEGGMAVTVNKMQGTTGQSKLDVPFGRFAFHMSKQHYYPGLVDSAHYAEIVNNSDLQTAMKVAQQIRRTERNKQASEPLQSPVTESPVDESSVEEFSNHQAVSDMFESFAQCDEMEDAQKPPADHKPEPKSDPTAR